MTYEEKKQELCCDDLKAAEGYLENCRTHLKKVMKPAEKAAADLEKATATEKARLQGTKEPKTPNLKPYTESIPARNRFDIGRLIASAKAEGRPWKISRCDEELAKQGYRYTFHTTRTESKPLSESQSKVRMPRLILSEDLDAEPSTEPVDPAELEFAEISLGEPEPSAEPAPEADEDRPMTFEEQMDFLAADEDEAIAGYEKIIAECEDEHVKEQLEKILIEERAHKEFVEKVKEDRTLEYSHEEDEEEDEKEKDEKGDDKESDKSDKEDKEGDEPSDKEPEPKEPSEDDEPLDEASTAEKRAFRNGGEDMDDLVTGKALARVKDPEERAMLLHQKRMERQGRKMTDRPEVSSTLRRKEDQALSDIEKKETKMAAAGLTEDDEPINEDVEIKLDDFTYFKPWGGAKDIWEFIISKNKTAELSKALENLYPKDKYPNGIKASELNDLLWFEKEWVLDKLGATPADMLKAPEEDVIDVEAHEIEPEEPKPEADEDAGDNE